MSCDNRHLSIPTVNNKQCDLCSYGKLWALVTDTMFYPHISLHGNVIVSDFWQYNIDSGIGKLFISKAIERKYLELPPCMFKLEEDELFEYTITYWNKRGAIILDKSLYTFDRESIIDLRYLKRILRMKPDWVRLRRVKLKYQDKIQSSYIYEIPDRYWLLVRRRQLKYSEHSYGSVIMLSFSKRDMMNRSKKYVLEIGDIWKIYKVDLVGGIDFI